MDLFASLLMLAATACWLTPPDRRRRADEALEWRLLSAPLAAAALLVWIESHGSGAAFARWLLHAAACAGAAGLAAATRQHDRLRRPLWTITSVSILAAGLWWGSARAQEDVATIAVEPLRAAGAENAQPLTALDTIVVTGTRTAHRLSDAPVDVQLITAADIRNSGARDLAELLEREGGIHASRLAGRGTRIEIQGLASEHVLVLIDGRRMIGRINGAIDLTRLRLDGIERIEIVRGPSSALYGADALGGVINLITRRRGGEAGALTLRADDEANAELFGNAGWALGERLGGRIGGGVLHTEPYDLDPATAGRDGIAGDSRSAQGTARWSPHAEFDLDADLAYALDDSRRVDDGTGGAVHDTRKRIEEVRAGIAPRIALGGATELRLDGYFNRYFDQYLQQPRGGGEAIDEETLDELWSGAAQLDHRIGLHRVTLGAEAQLETLEADRLGTTGERDRQSVFAQDELALRDGALALVAGARYDRDSQFGEQLSPKLSLRYELARDWILRAGYGHGYRAPDFKQLLLRFDNPAIGYRVDGNPALEPERSVAYNLGLTWFARRDASLALSAHHSAVEDLIEIVQVQNGPPIVYSYRNVASARLYGADLQLQLQLRPWSPLELRLGYGWLHSEDEASGRPLSGRPEHRANAALRFEQPDYALGLRGVWIGERVFGLDVDTGGAPIAAGRASAYALFDARAEWTRWRCCALALGIDNLFDAGDPAYLPIQPRSVSLELRWSFE
ncbi:outer membrane receptor for ferrienterochelin and colicins [Fontimonas thermophila]|uniref:Outer membrane receptor for ferrienterochelin and colicins n=1 Tax=Fontimonas thermophila TaxID=1076937 RepID=A0A1I2IE45_9GAMM|nr:TonB-dependent receptor [Fontimonas thermophila]SFF39096.1 outer membrane receptor for ferrienterochelin and colicins [Fontimonas thermophila]